MEQGKRCLYHHSYGTIYIILSFFSKFLSYISIASNINNLKSSVSGRKPALVANEPLHYMNPKFRLKHVFALPTCSTFLSGFQKCLDTIDLVAQDYHAVVVAEITTQHINYLTQSKAKVKNIANHVVTS